MSTDRDRPSEISVSEWERVLQEARTVAKGEESKPLTVAIMGQTGVGKSSLLNALFGAHLVVGDVRPTTKIPEPITITGATGHPLTFWDMPGIGESEKADSLYLSMYREKLLESDVVLWAIHADNRSVTFDAKALRELVGNSPPNEQRALMSKLTLVLTKADLLIPPPWIYMKDGETGTFVPSKTLRIRLEEKAQYYQEVFLQPFGHLIVAQTYNNEGFALDDSAFGYDEHQVLYRGFMTEAARDAYTKRYPEYGQVFERLYHNYLVIPCSALFRYNLLQLMVVIVNKLGLSAIGRFQQLVGDNSILNLVPVSQMQKNGNLVVWDARRGQKIFDLDDIQL